MESGSSLRIKINAEKMIVGGNDVRAVIGIFRQYDIQVAYSVSVKLLTHSDFYRY